MGMCRHAWVYTGVYVYIYIYAHLEMEGCMKRGVFTIKYTTFAIV